MIAVGAPKVGTPFVRRLRLWLILAAGVEIAAFLIKRSGLPSMPLYNFYWPVEFGALLALGATVAPIPRRYTFSLFALFLIGWAWNIATVDPFRQLASLSVIGGALVLAGLYLYVFWYGAGQWPGRLRQAPGFWLCLAVLIYYGASGPLLGSINYFMRSDMELAANLYRLTQALCVVKFACMAMACYHTRPAVHSPRIAHEPAS